MPITKANEAPKHSHLHIFGRPLSGRTYQAILAAKPFKNVLYVGFNKNSLAAYASKQDWEIPATWDTSIVRDWKTFNREITNPMKKGEIAYDCVILDDYDVGYEYVLDGVTSPERKHYLMVSNSLAMSATKLIGAVERSGAGRLIMTTQVMSTSDDDPTPRHYLSASNESRLFPKFASLMYTVWTGKKMTAQTLPVAASEFKIGKVV